MLQKLRKFKAENTATYRLATSTAVNANRKYRIKTNITRLYKKAITTAAKRDHKEIVKVMLN